MTATVLRFAGLASADEAAAVAAGDVYVDVARFQAFVGGKPVALTYQEFELLRLLVSKADRIIPYEELVRALWRSKAVGMRRPLGCRRVPLTHQAEAFPAVSHSDGARSGLRADGKHVSDSSLRLVVRN